MIESLGFSRVANIFPARSLPQSLLENYEENRDFPARNGTSKLSLHLEVWYGKHQKDYRPGNASFPNLLSELI